MTHIEKMDAPAWDGRTIAAWRRRLLAWYGRHRRALPWRNTHDPYAIWVSEIMLQQTRVAAVEERYLAFLDRFPTLATLARASEADVLALWSGLGYYRRARLLHRAAQQVAAHGKGLLPRTAAELVKLPGIGAYTAAAIASIAHGEPRAVVDGNVERVLCRVAGWNGGARGNASLRKAVEKLAAKLVDPVRPGDFNQAMMELGATVCLPRKPQCLVCPLETYCRTRGEHQTAPRKPMRSLEAGCALAVRKSAGGGERPAVLLERRPDSLTVMPGLWELPALRDAAVPESSLRMTVRHAIMQVNYLVRIRDVDEPEVDRLTVAGGERRWVAPEQAAAMALTGLARKVLARVKLLGGGELESG